MKNTAINGVIMNDIISKELSFLQKGYAMAIAEGIDEVIGFLLENNASFAYDNQKILGYLTTLHNARTEFRSLVPTNEEGGE